MLSRGGPYPSPRFLSDMEDDGRTAPAAERATACDAGETKAAAAGTERASAPFRALERYFMVVV